MMFVIIKDSNIIKKFYLKNNIDYKGIHIYSKNNGHYISLDRGLFFEDGSKIKQLSINYYQIKQENLFYSIFVYVYENDNGINDYGLYKTKPFLIINSNKANIVLKDKYLDGFYLGYKDGYLQSNFPILVNGCSYENNKLKRGDLIEFLGIRIFFFEEFIYINNFNIENRLDKYICNDVLVKYKDVKAVDSFSISDEIQELVVDEIKEYKPENKPNNLDFIKNLIPNFIMCICMGLMAYMNYLNNHSQNNILTYIIMPISMMLTGIIVPIIFVIISNTKYKKNSSKTKDAYIKYLDEYTNNLRNNIERYINSLNSRYFNLKDCDSKLFYASKKGNDFMKLSIGKLTISKDIKLPKANDKQINEKLNSINYLVTNINNCPLYLDLLKSRINTIVCKKGNKRYFFRKYILEASYKHHYEDVGIAVYSKNLNIFNEIYNLPHLFISNTRLTLNTFEDLQMLNQMHLEKPVILFMFDYIEFEFSNSNIYVVYFSEDITNLLKNSDSIIQYLNNNGYLYTQTKTKFEYIYEDIDFVKYFRELGKLKRINDSEIKYSFLDVFDSNIEYFYQNNDYGLKASFAYSNNELISFDLHESKQGPHGLIGGSTGSGKSELIVSMLLSLCIRYSPEYLNIVLIDYKGGGIKESLSYNGKTIPHIAASVSNLQDNALDRLIIALHNECRNRQRLFKELSSSSNTSIMNLDDYLQNNKGNCQKIPHLLIVVDEFAELKKENPEQIKELISISRIGRSLGIHLILATQKPAGVIDDEIWSNSRFKLALKVFDEKDSTDIIKSKDAAYLDNPGSFYLLIDSSIIKGQSIYSKNDINGEDPYKVSILNNTLNIDKTYKKQIHSINSVANYYCKKIIDATNVLDLKPINIKYETPIKKSRKALVFGSCIVMGEIDDYYNNTKGLLAYDLNESILICSSRKNEMNSILNALNENKRKTIVIARNQYLGSYISDSITYDNEDDIKYLFKLLLSNRICNITLVIEDLYCLLSYDEEYLEALCKLAKRKDNLSISLIFISTNCQLSYKLINAFNNKVLIGALDQSDLTTLFGTRSKYKGNSYFFKDEPVTFIPIEIEEYIESNSLVDKVVLSIPEIIDKDIKENKYLLGYDEENKTPVYENNVVVVSFNNELLDIYRIAYTNIETFMYDYSMKIDSSKNILWLGPSIFNQRLFVTGLKDDISYNQAYLLSKNGNKILRRLSNESEINEIQNN